MKWSWILMWFTFVINIPKLAWTTTLSNLLSETRVYLRDTSTLSNRQRFSDSQLTTFLNDGQQELNLRTWAVINSTSITLTGGTTEYPISQSDFIAIVRVTINESPIPERTFAFEDESLSPWIQDSSGVPKEYYFRIDSSAVSGAGREVIGFHPISSGTYTARVQYLAQPILMVNSSDQPFGGNARTVPYHQCLCYFAAWKGWLVEGEDNHASMFMNDYRDCENLAEATDKSKILFNPSFRGNPNLDYRISGQQLLNAIVGGQGGKTK